MASKVFISYAGQDPHWPAATVHALGMTLEAHGATVLLDQFLLERQSEPGKLSLDEWRDWMKASLKEADRVICLVSARYAQAVDRDLGEAWGHGVAYESLKLLRKLYADKGRNDKRVLTLRPDGEPMDLVPEDFRESCPEYQWPSERDAVIEHATRRRLAQADPPAAAPRAAPDPDPTPIEAGLVAQARVAQARLQGEPEFFQALQRNRDGDELQAAPAQARVAAAPFVRWLSSATLDEAQEVMWAVRTALDEHPGWCSHAGVQGAAVAVYMLCALRWVDSTTPPEASRVLAVPALGRHVLAVLSAALFGGRIEYALRAGAPQPLHVYDVRAPLGQAASTNLLRAIYCELFAEDLNALEIARRDDDDPRVVEHMVQRLQSRLNDIRRRRKLGFTLVIDQADTFEQAPWGSRLEVTPFTVDEQLAQAMFLLRPHQLDQEINELLRQIQPQRSAASAPPAPASPAPAPSAPASP